ncbi:hypothetical protein DFH11DRAFT_1515051 [Phellopilus nigrolimitatus]|nr:hypothetical protein DFH11DRAFT_1515051 [Phellopilus nigrolimitatus]
MHSIRSDVEPLDPSLVPLFISEIDITLYTLVTIITLLVYDTIITMDKEVNTAWHFRLHVQIDHCIIQIKYFWARHLFDISTRHMLTFHVERRALLAALEDWMTVILIDYILLMRVLALYHQDKKLAACLRTLFGLEAAFDMGLLIYANIYDEIVVLELAKDVILCGENRNPPKVWSALSWTAPMLYAIILMVLALYKAAEHWRETAGFSQFTLVKVLIQDQAIYFIMVIFVSVMEIMANQLDVPNALLAYLLTIVGSPSLLCVLGSHLLVHLKEAGERGANEGTSYRMKTMSNIEFS